MIHFIPPSPQVSGHGFLNKPWWPPDAWNRMLPSHIFLRFQPLKLDNQPKAVDKPNIFTRSWRRVEKNMLRVGEFHSWGLDDCIQWTLPIVLLCWWSIDICRTISSVQKIFGPSQAPHCITGAVTSHNPPRPCPMAQISSPSPVARCWWPWDGANGHRWGIEALINILK